VPAPAVEFDRRVLFVKADAAPYATLDAGIENGLRGIVREVHTAGEQDDAVAIAAAIRPDLVLVLDPSGRPFPLERVQAIRQMGIRTVVWFPDDPYHTDRTTESAPHYDMVFTLESACIPFYRERGVANVHHVPFGVDPEAVRPVKVESSYKYDICFIGTAYWQRAAFFDQIAGYLKERRTFINGWWWDRMANYSMLADRISGYWLSPEETFRFYSGAKIVINLHRSADDPTHNGNAARVSAMSANPRVFEIAACAALQLVDARAEIPALYRPGEEIDTFTTPEELTAKIDYYLANEELRRTVAWNGYLRTLRDHTFRSRLRTLLALALG
jgi:spore maturation protein CgeB